MKEKVETIIENYSPLIKSCIKKYANYPYLYEDLFQDGVVKVLELIKLYDPKKGVEFSHFLKVYLTQFYKNKASYQKYREHLEFDPEKMIAGVVEGPERALFIKEMMKLLDPVDRIIIYQNLICGERIRDIAKLLNMSERQCYYRKEKAIRYLNKLFRE